MSVPITNLRINDITTELGISYIFLNEVENIFKYVGVNPLGLDNTYCSGSDSNARLVNLRTRPYEIGKWRNYNHTSASIPPYPSFSVSTDILIYDVQNLYKITPPNFTPIPMGSLTGSEFGNFNDFASITMSSNKIFRTLFASEKLEVFNVTYTPNFTTTYSGSINLSEPSINGIDYKSNQIVYGYSLENPPTYGGENQRIGYIDITDTPPLPISNGFQIRDSIFAHDQIRGDILWDPIDDVLFSILRDAYVGGNRFVIRKFSLLGSVLDEEGYGSTDIGNVLFNDPNSSNLINITEDGGVYSVNRSTLTRTLISSISNAGWRGSAQVH